MNSISVWKYNDGSLALSDGHMGWIPDDGDLSDNLIYRAARPTSPAVTS